MPWIAIVLAAFAAGAVGGVVGSRLSGEAPTVTAPPPAPVPTASLHRLQSVIALASPAVVRVEASVFDESGGLLGTSVGSGIVVDERGLVLTNFHVIDGASDIAIVLATGERRSADYVADDAPFQDLALLSIEPGGLRSIEIMDSPQPVPGDQVIMISSSLIPGGTQARAGLVSDVNVMIDRPDVILEGLIQTDVGVNLGDSGGALLNSSGALIGLVTANLRTLPTGEDIEAIGFAQSIAMIGPIVEAVRRTGLSTRPRYGFERFGSGHIAITQQISAEFALPVEAGAVVTGVALDSPAEDSGLRVGDLIVAVDGVAVDQHHTLPDLLKSGRPVRLAVLRDDMALQLTVSPAPLPPRQQ